MVTFDNIKNELIETLTNNSQFTGETFYKSMFEVTTNTKKPCHSIDLDRDTQGENEYSGGMIRKYKVEGILITYIEPEIKKESIGTILDNYRESAKDALQNMADSGDWQYISEYTYMESYPQPWTTQYPNGPQITAHRMITKFMIEYEVIRL